MWTLWISWLLGMNIKDVLVAILQELGDFVVQQDPILGYFNSMAVLAFDALLMAIDQVFYEINGDLLIGSEIYAYNYGKEVENLPL